jgi:1-acyl-sn-glycerol-3-phosphate acyltransferase
MKAFWRYAFVLLVAWPVMLLWLGLNVRHRERLVAGGPAIVAANHNSHLDTLALLTLFPLELIPRIRPVAAADYFMRPGFMAWFSRNVVGIIPVVRDGRAGRDPLGECYAALERGDILIIFPEGSRGEAERMTEFKSGIAHLAARFPHVPVLPVFMHGTGKSMPRGTFAPVPFFIDIFVGEPLVWSGTRESFMSRLREAFDALRAELHAPEYT